ncbi:MAG: DUF3109 family protein [Prolixibacteraceae bacterium]|nr:DUF3109 family protein [Prolixibacteraceae bacterium]MBN2772788.1 DUF3109 family protein [Prolixibacteraceae bacterium]
MLEIGRAIVSLDIIEKYFLCDLMQCKGACCVEGDSGAPVTVEETKKLEEVYPKVKKYLSERNNRLILKQGLYFTDNDGDLVTSLVGNKECVFTFRDKNGILKCSIEKAFLNGEIDFRKPVSCHLFPIRITEYKRFDAVNYEKLDICKPGRKCGASEKLPLYKFLREPLIRKYGKEWYEQLEIAAEYLTAKKDQT